MIWIIFTAPDGALWYGRPQYNDLLRPRKATYIGRKFPVIPPGTDPPTVTDGDVVVTLDDITVAGESIYSESNEERRTQLIERWIDDDNVPLTAEITTHLVEHTAVPADHTCGIRCEFRNAWTWNDRVVVDLTKARVIHMNTIRTARNKELVKLDVSWMQAVEAGDTSTQSTIATEKQVLRDIPATFDITTGVTTPELLKAKWPTELPARE